MQTILVRWVLVAALLALGGCDSPSEVDAGPGGDGGGVLDAGAVVGGPTLYVVNNNSALTSYAGVDTLEGDVAPSTRLANGSATMLFQPRAAVVTSSGRLLVGRQNSGLVGWDDATSATEEAPAQLTVDGDATSLERVVSLAYDAASDRLFVGRVDAAEGVLVFDDVSAAGFDGDLAPARSFAPSDRVPYHPTGTIEMTIDALFLSGDTLYAVDTSGLNVNASRILAFDGAGAADGVQEPRVIESDAWGKVRSIAVVDGRLLALDESDVVFVIDDIQNAEGAVTPTEVTVAGARRGLNAVELGSGGAIYLADGSNAAILIFESGIDGATASVTADRILEGSATGLRTPRDLVFVE